MMSGGNIQYCDWCLQVSRFLCCVSNDVRLTMTRLSRKDGLISCALEFSCTHSRAHLTKQFSESDLQASCPSL